VYYRMIMCLGWWADGPLDRNLIGRHTEGGSGVLTEYCRSCGCQSRVYLEGTVVATASSRCLGWKQCCGVVHPWCHFDPKAGGIPAAVHGQMRRWAVVHCAVPCVPRDHPPVRLMVQYFPGLLPKSRRRAVCITATKFGKHKSHTLHLQHFMPLSHTLRHAMSTPIGIEKQKTCWNLQFGLVEGSRSHFISAVTDGGPSKTSQIQNIKIQCAMHSQRQAWNNSLMCLIGGRNSEFVGITFKPDGRSTMGSRLPPSMARISTFLDKGNTPIPHASRNQQYL